MSYSLARTGTHVTLFMGIVSLASLFIADYATSPAAYVLLGIFGAACLVMSFALRRVCRCPHCGKSIILYRHLPPSCPFCEGDFSGKKP